MTSGQATTPPESFLPPATPTLRLMEYAARMGIGEKSSQKKALEMGCEAAALNCLKAGEQHGLPLRAAIGDVARSHGPASSKVRATRAPTT